MRYINLRFTVKFATGQFSEPLSFGLDFVPCPVWTQDRQEIINLNPDNPHYQIGSVRRLLEKVPDIAEKSSRYCVILLDGKGNADGEDLNNLVKDLSGNGFTVQVLDRRNHE